MPAAGRAAGVETNGAACDCYFPLRNATGFSPRVGADHGGDLPAHLRVDAVLVALVAFCVRIYNNAGTLQHAIGAYNSPATAGTWSGKIAGASASYTATPTGADATTAMAAGGKISATNTNRFILNTAQQAAASVFLDCSLSPAAPFRTSMRCSVVLQSRDVNGVTRRPERMASQK